ncbi:fungal-specific transcription factor domain-containing protein [Lipomyces arxii]|uniref:fungal-specific transcription factor domain-containing protein n=1 Tax=Lipomyces arxii TaxID=56418 RepID=UPI0034CE712E
MSVPLVASSIYWNESQRQQLRRAARACAGCHARKVRCDAQKLGTPCSNCRNDNHECYMEPKKRRKSRKDNVFVKVQNVKQPLDNAAEDLQAFSARIEQVNQNASSSMQPMAQGLPRLQVPHYHHFLLKYAHVTIVDQSENRKRPTLLSHLEGRQNIKSLSDKSCISDDFGLKNKEISHVLPYEIMSELVSCYFSIVHPFFPLIDKVAFLHSFSLLESCPNVSESSSRSILLQAVLFSASNVAPIDLLKRTKFDSRKQTQRILYNQVVNLYHSGNEQDDILTIQALLLISHYFPSMTDQRHSWHWVNQAITLAQSNGLHRHTENVLQQQVWARTWWACLVRDRLISIGNGRPMHINSLDCDVKELAIGDLVEPGDGEHEITLKMLFIEFVRLCQCMEGVLNLHKPGSAAGNNLTEEIRICSTALETWYENLAQEARRNEEASIDGSERVIDFYRSLLHALYNQSTTVVALFQPYHILESSQSTAFYQYAHQKVRKAAADTSDLLANLVAKDLTVFCPSYGVTITIPPLIIHLLDLRAAQSVNDKRISLGRYNDCMLFLSKLSNKFWHAGFYYDFFELAALDQNKLDTSREGSIQVQFVKPQWHSVRAETDITGKSSKLIGMQSSYSNSSVSTLEPSTTVESDKRAKAATDINSINNVDPWVGFDGYDMTKDLELQFEDWLGAQERFQSIFPSG